MFNLILKDILIQKKNILYMFLYIAIAFAVMDGLGSTSLYILITTTIAFQLSYGAFAIDEKTKGDRIIASLPVSRRDIVLSKYLSMIVFAAGSVAVMSAVGIIGNMFNMKFIRLNYITFSEVKAILFICIFLSSINYPLNFILGYTKAKVLSFIIYFTFFSLAIFLFDNINEEPVKSIIKFFTNGYSGSFQIIGFLVLIVIFLASYFISLNSYEKKEL